MLISTSHESPPPRYGTVQICEAFGANRYPLPEEPNRQRAMAAEVGVWECGGEVGKGRLDSEPIP